MSIKENIVTEVYKDVISPISKQIWSTAGEVAKLILAPIYQPTKLLNNRIDKCFERISKKVPKDKLMDVCFHLNLKIFGYFENYFYQHRNIPFFYA